MSAERGAAPHAAGAKIESILSARLFLTPQVVGRRIFFVSNLGGHLSLYAMDADGSVPEPLLPPDIALQNPILVGGYLYYVFPKLRRILLMLDRNGDENYQPMFVPMDGGLPEPAFGDAFADHRVHLTLVDTDRNMAYFAAESRKEQMLYAYQSNLARKNLVRLGQSPWGSLPDAVAEDHARAVLIDGYTAGDNVLYLWRKGAGERTLLHGKPLEARREGEVVPPNGISGCNFVGDRGVLCMTFLFEDTGGLGWIDLKDPQEIRPVAIAGKAHRGIGDLVGLEHLKGNRYLVQYNIDGCSWAYEGTFDPRARKMRLTKVIVGKGPLANGVLESIRYDKKSNRYALSFSTATSPTQIFTVDGPARKLRQRTRERVLGIPERYLSAGEDASYTSYDGTRVSARMYLPAKQLGYRGPRPLVYYVHGGPQSQERPDFAWFSMPLIQYLTLNGFAVFVPNVRGSTGYGMSYMKQVDRDWGGNDRLDHVHAMTKVLPEDPRVDVSRTGVVGRSYGGYMTLTLAARHPELWSAACDMFGPYDLLTFSERIPETWKPYFVIALGDPVKDKEFLVERSPRTYMDDIRCPLLVIQGRNDPRVIEQESKDVVDNLKAAGRDVDFLVFEDEGHDVLKFKNRVTCYNAITAFFREHLSP